MNYEIATREQTYSERDVILYALGVGLCMDGVSRTELPFVYEKDLKVLPMMCCVLGTPGMWLAKPDTGVNYLKVVHGEMGFTIHKPLPSAGSVRATTRVTDIFDKGEGVGALIVTQSDICDRESGEKFATTTSTIFARGNGGFGGERGPSSVKVI